MHDTVIAQVDALIQRQPNCIDFLDRKKHPIEDHDITGVDAEETEALHIQLIGSETDLHPIPAGTETLPELVERNDIPNIELK